MKIKLLISAASFLFAVNAFAKPVNTPKTSKESLIKSNIYVGIGSGFADSFYDKDYIKDADSIKRVKHINLAYRVFAGYNVNKNISVEMGYALLPKVKFEGIKFGEYDVYQSVKQQALDAFARYTYPLSDKVNLFGGAGASLIHFSDLRVKVNGQTIDTKLSPTNRVVPAAQVGAQYAANKNIGIRVSDELYIGRHELASTNVLTADVVYSF